MLLLHAGYIKIITKSEKHCSGSFSFSREIRAEERNRGMSLYCEEREITFRVQVCVSERDGDSSLFNLLRTGNHRSLKVQSCNISLAAHSLAARLQQNRHLSSHLFALSKCVLRALGTIILTKYNVRPHRPLNIEKRVIMATSNQWNNLLILPGSTRVSVDVAQISRSNDSCSSII